MCMPADWFPEVLMAEDFDRVCGPFETIGPCRYVKLDCRTDASTLLCPVNVTLLDARTEEAFCYFIATFLTSFWPVVVC